MKKKPRPSKGGSVIVSAEEIDGQHMVEITLDERYSAELTPAQAKRIARKILEIAEYIEEMGE